MMARKNLYKGFSSHEYQANRTFKLRDVELVKMDLLNHIFTRRGERVMMPTFGTSIPDMAFEPLDEILLEEIRDELEAVFNYDPRVEIIDLEITPYEDENRVEVEAILRYVEFNIVDNLNININTGSGF